MNIRRNQVLQAIVLTILLFALTHFSVVIIKPPSPVTIAYAQPDGESVQIQPFRWEESQTVYSDQEIVFTLGWGACQKGQVHDYLNAVDLAFTLDGQPVFSSTNDAKQFWGPVQEIPAGPGAAYCVGGTPDTIWRSDWVYNLGKLAAGDHVVYFAHQVDHPVIDGGDYNEDGKPDVFEGMLREREFIIHVEDRPVDHPAAVEIHPLRWDASQTLYSDQEIVFFLGWGACKQGMVQDYLNAVDMIFTLDSQALFSSKEEMNQYWGAVYETAAGPGAAYCLGGAPDTIWRSDWRYSYSKLPAGDYTVYFANHVVHPVIDGGDYDGDGKPDIFENIIRDREFIIHVEDRPQ